MEVVLLKDLSIGDRGAIIKVSDGHARNYLLPNRLALIATASNRKHFNKIQEQQQKKLSKEKAELESLAKKINEHAGLIFTAKAGENGMLFGSITNEQITQGLSEAHKYAFDKRRVLVKNLREAGAHSVTIKLPFGINAVAKVKIDAEIIKTKEEGAAKKSTRARKKKEEGEAAEVENKETSEKETKASATKEKKEKAEKPHAKKKAADK